MIREFCIVAGILFITVMRLQADDSNRGTSNYQRGDFTWGISELTTEGAFSYWQDNIADGSTYHNIRYDISLEYIFNTKHSVSFALPWTLCIFNNKDVRQNGFHSFGDIQLSYDYLYQLNHINLFIGPRFFIPLVETNEYAAREGIFSASAGRFMAGFLCAVTGIRDPIVWNVELQYVFGFPKEERFYTSVHPGIIRIQAGFSDLLNSLFGFSIALRQIINLPVFKGSHYDTQELSVSSGIKLEFFILFEKDYVRVFSEFVFYPLNKPFISGILYGHKFEIRKQNKLI